MKRLTGATAIVTVFAGGLHLSTFFAQVIIAAWFGTRAEMDAFLAATTLPQYLCAVVLNALGVVFIPVLVERRTTGRPGEADALVSAIVTWGVLATSAVTLLGALWAEPLLRLTTPGLPERSIALATRIALITWPTVVASAVVSILGGVYQAAQRFTWAAAVPAIGGIVNLALMPILVPELGIVGVAISATASTVLQVVLLLPILTRRGVRFTLTTGFDSPAFYQVLRLLWPLLVAGAFYRANPVVDRYCASIIGPGAISHLGYAYKLIGVVTTLVATGLTTVAFPVMAQNKADGDGAAFNRTLSVSLRMMWLAVAPTMTVGAVLALPLVSLVFRRGAFTAADAESVAYLLQIYFLSMVGACLGNLTGRAFYALKKTRTVACLGILDAVGYAIYAPVLARYFGVVGVAFAYVIYLNFGLLVQALVLRRSLKTQPGSTATAFARVALAAIAAGLLAHVAAALFAVAWLKVLVATVVGLSAYTAVLALLRADEVRWVAGAIGPLRPTRPLALKG